MPDEQGLEVFSFGRFLIEAARALEALYGEFAAKGFGPPKFERQAPENRDVFNPLSGERESVVGRSVCERNSHVLDLRLSSLEGGNAVAIVVFRQGEREPLDRLCCRQEREEVALVFAPPRGWSRRIIARTNRGEPHWLDEVGAKGLDGSNTQPIGDGERRETVAFIARVMTAAQGPK